MKTLTTVPLHELYLLDETAWLETMAVLAAEGRFADMDHRNLSEYLSDMAIRDRREVTSRLSLLLAHLSKWEHQPSHRSGSRRLTIELQRQALAELLESGTLRRHAQEVLAKAYRNGVLQAVAETGLDQTIFPDECPFTLDDILTSPVI